MLILTLKFYPKSMSTYTKYNFNNEKKRINSYDKDNVKYFSDNLLYTCLINMYICTKYSFNMEYICYNIA